MSEAWSQEEVEAAVADYFDMLGMELRDESYNKADYTRYLQRLLREVVEQRLSGGTALHQTVARVVESQVDAVPDFGDILSIQVSPPSRERSEGRLYERAETPRNPVRRNYLELEARNQSLGRAGEEMVLKFEHTRLWRAGQRTLADDNSRSCSC